MKFTNSPSGKCHKARIIFLNFYILMNLLNGVYFYATGKLGGDLFGYEYKNHILLVLSIALSIIGLVFCGLIVPKFTTFKQNLTIIVPHNFAVKISILLILFLGYIFTIKFKVGVSGFSYDKVPQWVIYFNGILNPTYAILIYLYVFCNRRDHFYNFILLASLPIPLLKGFMGFYIYYAVLFYVLSKDGFNFQLILLSVLSVLISPFIRMLKYVIGTGDSIPLSEMNQAFKTFINSHDIDLSSLYIQYFFSILERFQHVSNIYFIFENYQRFVYDLDRGYYAYFMMDGMVQKFVCNVIFEGCAKYSIQQVSATYINGMDNWQSATGFFSWLAINPLFVAPLLFYTFIIYGMAIFLSRLIKNSNLNLFTWCLFIITVSHGWFNDFVNYIITMSVLISLWFLFSILNLNVKKY